MNTLPAAFFEYEAAQFLKVYVICGVECVTQIKKKNGESEWEGENARKNYWQFRWNLWQIRDGTDVATVTIIRKCSFHSVRNACVKCQQRSDGTTSISSKYSLVYHMENEKEKERDKKKKSIWNDAHNFISLRPNIHNILTLPVVCVCLVWISRIGLRVLCVCVCVCVWCTCVQYPNMYSMLLIWWKLSCPFFFPITRGLRRRNRIRVVSALMFFKSLFIVTYRSMLRFWIGNTRHRPLKNTRKTDLIFYTSIFANNQNV